jgi:choline dehydrogenase-like flavoprotein
VLLTLTPETIIQATKELGIHMPADQASGDAIGGYFCPHNQDPTTQTRSSAREAYYETAKGRPNFEILTGYQVTRIITKKTAALTRATGVEVSHSKRRPRRLELILAYSLLRAMVQTDRSSQWTRKLSLPRAQSIRPRSYNCLALVTPNFSLKLASKQR